MTNDLDARPPHLLTGLLTVAPWIDATRSRAVVTLARIGGAWERDGAGAAAPGAHLGVDLLAAPTDRRPALKPLGPAHRREPCWRPSPPEVRRRRSSSPPRSPWTATPWLMPCPRSDRAPLEGSAALGLHRLCSDRWGDDLLIQTPPSSPQGHARSPHGLGALCWRRDRVALVMLQGAAWLWLLHAAAAVLQRPPPRAPAAPSAAPGPPLAANHARGGPGPRRVVCAGDRARARRATGQGAGADTLGLSRDVVCGAQRRKGSKTQPSRPGRSRGGVERTPDLLAPWREKNNAATTTLRPQRRSPHPDRSRRAAEPQSAHLKRDRRRHPRPLCGSAPLRETNHAATTTSRSKSRSPPHPDRSRTAASRQAAPRHRGSDSPIRAPASPTPQLFSPPPLASSRRISHAPDVRLLRTRSPRKPRSLSQHQKHEGAPVYHHRSARRTPRC
jgi:hypothetical protein